MLLPIRWPVASAVFLIVLYETVLSTTVADYLAQSIAFDYIYHLNFYFYFCQYFYPYLGKTMIHGPKQIFNSLGLIFLS